MTSFSHAKEGRHIYKTCPMRRCTASIPLSSRWKIALKKSKMSMQRFYDEKVTPVAKTLASRKAG